MVSNVVLELALLVFVLFLPGFLLVNVLFPGRGSLGGNLDLVYRLLFAVVLSVALAVLYGTLLIMLAGSDQVLLLPETLWPGLAILSLILFLVGLARGAYPPIVRLLGRTPAPPGRRNGAEDDLVDRLLEISDQIEAAEAAEGGEDPHIEELRKEKRRLEEEAARKA